MSSETEVSAKLTAEEEKSMRINTVQKYSIENERYLRSHPEITLIIQHVIEECMLVQPDEPVRFVEEILKTKDLKALCNYLSAKKEVRHLRN